MKVLIAAAIAALLVCSGCATARYSAARAPSWDGDVPSIPEIVVHAGTFSKEVLPLATENYAGRILREFGSFPEFLGAREEVSKGFPFDICETGGMNGMTKGKLLKLRGQLEANEPKKEEAKSLKKIPVLGHLFAATGAGGRGRLVMDKRKMIYTAQFALKVYDLEKSAKKIIRLAQKAGGYISTQTNEALVIRVPAGKFKEVVDALDDVGQVVQKNIQAQDVTQQYMDLSLRIGAKRKYLETLQKLLDKTTDAKALLEIQKEIGRVIEEIESLEGRLRYLGDQVAYSTISVRLLLATKQAHRRFRLPIDWIERLGIDHLVVPGGGAR